jgi:DNA-binding transcriptional LysR family regulator
MLIAVETQLLRTFVAVARLGSFSAAALELGYTQAAVSQQIAALENDLKTQLLSRRPVAPTEAGARLLEHAEPILLRLDAARTDVTRLTNSPRATLRVGATPLAGAVSPLGAALAELRARMPRVELSVAMAPRQEIAVAAAKGDVDLALTDGLVAPTDPLPMPVPVTAIGLHEEGVRVVLPPDHPLAARPSLRLADLANARWIEAGCVAPSLEEIRRHAGAGQDGFKPVLQYTGQDTATLITLAAAGHGLTLLPESALSSRLGAASVPIAHPRLSHRVELLHAALQQRSPAAALAAILSGR